WICPRCHDDHGGKGCNDREMCICGHMFMGHAHRTFATSDGRLPCNFDGCECGDARGNGEAVAQVEMPPPMNFWELDPYQQHEHEAYTTNIDGSWFCKCG